MKKTFLLLILTIFSINIMAANTAVGLTSTAETSVVAITPTAESTTVPTQAEQGKNVFDGSVSKIIFDVKSAFQDDGAGQIYTNELAIKARQTLFKNFSADVFIRFIKPMSNENTPVITELLSAKFQYINNFFQVIAGRAELTKTISTMNYFGPYATAGQRYLDLVGFTIPFYLKAGVPELEEIDLPQIAFSFYYMPAMLNLANTTYDGLQEFYLGQVRVNTNLWDNPTQFILNVGKGTTQYFAYSILSGKAVVDFSASIDLKDHYKVNIAAGILNTDKTNETAVVAAGLELHDLKQWLFVLDKLIVEVQVPIGQIPTTSADFNPETMPWFVTLGNKVGNFRYGIAATTAANDFTLSSIKSYRPGFTGPFGSGNVYAPEGLSFEKKSGMGTSWYGYLGYEF